ncbi:hypothetical protein Bwad001_32130 [Bilophila wadsworthia]
MEVLEFSDLPHNKAPFLTVGGFLFSVPDSSHWAAHHDECTETASRSGLTNKDGPPARRFPAGFKGSNASFKTAAASYLVYPTDGLPTHLPGKLTKPVGHLNGSPCSVWRTAPSI